MTTLDTVLTSVAILTDVLASHCNNILTELTSAALTEKNIGG